MNPPVRPAVIAAVRNAVRSAVSPAVEPPPEPDPESLLAPETPPDEFATGEGDPPAAIWASPFIPAED